MGSDGADYEEAFYQLQDIYGISKKVIGEKEEKTGVIYHDFQGVASSGKNLVKVKGKLIPWRFKSSE